MPSSNGFSGQPVPRAGRRAGPSLRLVIDASVISSASDREDSSDLTPIACRACLDAVRHVCHHLVITPDLQREWKRHRSRFANTWRTSMYARKKVFALGERPKDEALAEVIMATAESDSEKRELEKDLVLVEAALATDSVVISRDREARRLLARAAAVVPQLRSLVWIDPVHDQNGIPGLEGRIDLRAALSLV